LMCRIRLSQNQGDGNGKLKCGSAGMKGNRGAWGAVERGINCCNHRGYNVRSGVVGAPGAARYVRGGRVGTCIGAAGPRTGIGAGAAIGAGR